MTVRAQEAADTTQTALTESDLHLPTLNSYGLMPAPINCWFMNHFTGFYDWNLHQGMNVALGASVFAGLDDYAPSGAGFAQNVSGMYAMPLSKRLSLAFGGYFMNADWGGFNLRDAGLSAVLSYRFNEHWEGYLYGQKSVMEPKIRWPYYGMNDLGDRIGAAIRYNFNPSFYVQLRVEFDKNQYAIGGCP